MAKPKGGRGIKSDKPTVVCRIPSEISLVVDWISEKFRDGEWNGTKEDLASLLEVPENTPNSFKKAIAEILQRAENQETGYTTKSFSRGLKRLKRLAR